MNRREFLRQLAGSAIASYLPFYGRTSGQAIHCQSRTIEMNGVCFVQTIRQGGYKTYAFWSTGETMAPFASWDRILTNDEMVFMVSDVTTVDVRRFLSHD